MTKENKDWDPETYARFRGLRLRPALDLMAQIPPLPGGDIIDLGCGNGMPATELKRRFTTTSDRKLIGIDSSKAMLDQSAELGVFDRLDLADVAHWSPEEAPALIFSNALLHWLPDHQILFPRLAQALIKSGVLAVQMPCQFLEPSHKLLRDIAQAELPNHFEFGNWTSPVHELEFYHSCLAPLGSVTLWETTYLQELEPVQSGHPVRHFTQSTAMRPILDKLNDVETTQFVAAYDRALAQAYPVMANGGALMPFKRRFIVLQRH